MERESGHRGRIYLAIGIAALALFFLFWFAIVADFLLLAFGSVLLAVFLRGLGNILSKYSPLSSGAAFAAVTLSFVGVTVLSGIVLAPRFAEQVEEFAHQLPAFLDDAEAFLLDVPLGEHVLEGIRNTLGENNKELPGILASLLPPALQALVYGFIVFIGGLYLGVNPGWYVNGIVRLFPLGRRELVRHTLNEVGRTLRWFLIGRAVSMVAVGVLTTVGLSIIGIPLAGLLGVLAGILTFIPYAGPIAAAFPIGIVALLEGPAELVYALVFYTAVQSVEGFWITPVVQERAILLPPFVTIAAELLMGLLFGALGVIVSVPLAGAVMVLVKIVYVENVLEDTG